MSAFVRVPVSVPRVVCCVCSCPCICRFWLLFVWPLLFVFVKICDLAYSAFEHVADGDYLCQLATAIDVAEKEARQHEGGQHALAHTPQQTPTSATASDLRTLVLTPQATVDEGDDDEVVARVPTPASADTPSPINTPLKEAVRSRLIADCHV